MAKYVRVGRDVRKAMLALTPLVEPLSIDEAFLDLTGTERLHGMSAAQACWRALPRGRARHRHHGFGRAVGQQVPRQDRLRHGQAARLCRARPDEAAAFLAPKPVGFIFGVGAVSAAKLANDGFRLIADLQRADETDLMRRYGEEGAGCGGWRAASTSAASSAERETKSISAETTFDRDISDSGRSNSSCGG